MFIHNINPVLFSIGPLSIRYYGIIYALGFILAYLLLRHFVKQGKIKHMQLKDVDDYIMWLVLGVVVGARVIDYVFFYWPAIFTDPVGIFRIWEGGLSFHGGLLGAALVTYWYCKKKKIFFYDLADLLVIPAALALFLGRIANFINGELWGTITDVPWCVQFQGAEGCRHPSQLYEAAYTIIIFFSLLFVHNKKKTASKHSFLHTPGFVFWLFWLLYGLFRFVENFWREDPRLFGISMGQYACIGMVIVAAIMLTRLRKIG
ncbi:MAG: prolipoprotein diacylglyceryl transferase [archaeon]